MVYEVIARKWRPQIFQDVIGQEHITQTLLNALNTDRLAHAYLFSGARGVGKTSVARILAKAINCQEGNDGNPCNQCSSCLEITNGSSVDVQEIDGASNRGIDEIRELRENIKYMPSSRKYRVYIIDEVHMLTLQAFNALLKTLEEPPPHVKFLFATTEPHKVPITILSRCQRFDFKRIPLIHIASHLERIAESDGIKISKSGIMIIARESEGSMRDAQSLLDQVSSFTGAQVEDKDIIDILGIIDRDLLFETSRSIINGSSSDCMGIVEKIYNFGYDIKEFYRALMDQYRNLLVSLIAPENDLLDMTQNDKDELRLQAEDAGQEKLQQSLNILIAREEDLRYSSHPRLILETIMIKLSQLGDLLSFEDLLKKIEGLEKRLSSSSPSYETVSPVQVSEPPEEWVREEKAPELEKPEESEESEEPQEPVKPEEPEKPEVPVVSSEPKSWEDLLSFIATKNRPMASMLKGWGLNNLSEDVLEIIRGDSLISSDYLDEPERYEKFAGYCREFFDKKMKIRLVGAKFKNSKKDVRVEQKPKQGRELEKEKHPDISPPVQEVLKIFQGEIIGEVPDKK